LRKSFDGLLGKGEVLIYAALALFLALTIVLTLLTSARLLWLALTEWTVAAQTLRVLNQLLIVLMLVEILHTMRVSIRSRILVIEPFLLIGLIAVIRRMLIISLEAAALNREGEWATEMASSIFHAAMLELGLLGALVLVLVLSIFILRRAQPVAQAVRGPAA
jgi:hypothetical protein